VRAAEYLLIALAAASKAHRPARGGARQPRKLSADRRSQ
jgi:hypothetical protein